jgi:thiamine biosynthesis lipoprotein
MAVTIKSRCLAMGTFFEAYLSGENSAYLEDVAQSLWDEVLRIERMLSRFDPAGEVYRLNGRGEIATHRLTRELFMVLQACQEYRKLTEGFFDVAIGTGQSEPYSLDEIHGTVRFAHSDVRFDLGAYGKGYALDRLNVILKEHGIQSALLNAGRSSILARGGGPDGSHWQVAIAHPDARDGGVLLPLRDSALSCSAIFDEGQTVSDIIDPRTGQRLTAQAMCVIVDQSAAVAECLSTSCLVMGEDRAKVWARDRQCGSGIAFVHETDRKTVVNWLHPLSGERA